MKKKKNNNIQGILFQVNSTKHKAANVQQATKVTNQKAKDFTNRVQSLNNLTQGKTFWGCFRKGCYSQSGNCVNRQVVTTKANINMTHRKCLLKYRIDLSPWLLTKFQLVKFLLKKSLSPSPHHFITHKTNMPVKQIYTLVIQCKATGSLYWLPYQMLIVILPLLFCSSQPPGARRRDSQVTTQG